VKDCDDDDTVLARCFCLCRLLLDGNAIELIVSTVGDSGRR
jgi:hypothetical protein